MNIRPYRDALRKKWPTGSWKYTNCQFDKTRIVTLHQLFRGRHPVPDGQDAKKDDRWVTIQIWEDGLQRVSHAMVTADCPVDPLPNGPRRYRATTYPTEFGPPRELIRAVEMELVRTDHKELV